MLTLILLKPDRSTHTYRLEDQTPQVLGRRGEVIRLQDSRVSREHAEVSVQNGIWVIRDLGSANGTWVNGHRIEGLCELEEGDRIQIGRLNLIVGHVEVDLALDEASQAPDDSHELTADERAAQTVITAPSVDVPDDDEIQLQVQPDEIADNASSPLLKEQDDEADDDDDLDVQGLIDDELLLESPGTVKHGVSTPADVPDLNADDDDAFDALSDTPSGPIDADEQDEHPAPLHVADVAEHDEAPPQDDADRIDEPRPARPESPLAASPPPADDTSDLDVDPAAIDADHDEDSADDEAPELVGLSLYMPAPPAAADADAAGVNELEDDDSPVSVQDIEAMLDDEGDQAFEASNEQEPPEAAAASDENATRVLIEDEDDSAVVAVAEGEPEPETYVLADREPKRSPWKAVAAVLLFCGLAGGGAWWYLNQQASSTSPTHQDASLAETTPAAPQATPPAKPATVAASPAPVVATPSEADTTPSPTDPFGAGQQLALSTRPAEPALPTSSSLTPPKPPVEPAEVAPATEPTQASTTPPTAASSVASSETATNSTTDTTTTPDSEKAMPTVAETADVTPESSASQSADATSTAADDTLAKNRAKPMVDVATPAEAEPAAAEASTAAAATGDRRVAFLVDSSGSMVDSMDQGVMSWLTEQVNGLSPSDSFTILFFHSDEVVEVPPTGLKQASRTARGKALAWIAPNNGNIRLYGKSAPLKALQQAGQYDVNEMYILTDNKFGRLSSRTAPIDSSVFADVLGQRDVVVHTVQFFYRGDEDDTNLQRIAQSFGGTYEFVQEPTFEVTDGFNLLGNRQ